MFVVLNLKLILLETVHQFVIVYASNKGLGMPVQRCMLARTFAAHTHKVGMKMRGQITIILAFSSTR